MKFVRLFAMFFLILLSFGSGAQNAAGPTQIWFSPLTWNLKQPGPGIEYTKYDFPALLQPDAPWQTAVSRLSVFELPGNVVWSYPDLPALVAFLKSHRFKVALSVGVLFSGGTCGKGVEGISQDPDITRETIIIAQKWKAAGGTLDYLVMDGPYYFGAYYAKDCHYSIQDVADRAGTTVKGVLNYFPDVQVGDAEGPGQILDEQWLPGMAEWFKDFQGVTGKKIEVVALDLHWHDLRPGYTWQTTTQRSVAYFHRLGVRTGLIIDAEPYPTMTDEQWMNDTRQHLREVATAKLGLDFVDIESWMKHPSRNLPERDPTAFTSLIDYAATQSWK